MGPDFQSYGKTYQAAKLVIYSDKTVMPGGVADSRMGPFYMAANQTVYIDPNFFNEMKQRFGAPGDFAQADFLAGVFARHADEQFDFLETGDIEEAMNCAQAIGDDTLQRSAGRKVTPDSFTHGTSEQRARWFMKGFKTGRLEDGDTFDIPYNQL